MGYDHNGLRRAARDTFSVNVELTVIGRVFIL